MKEQLERVSLEEWVEEFGRANRGLWEKLDSASAWLRFTEHATTSIAELVRREELNELIEELGCAFGMLCYFVKLYGIPRPREPFQFLSALPEMVWRKYPGVCYRCTHKFSEEEVAKQDYLACSCLAVPVISKGEECIRRKHLDLARRSKRKPITVDEWADMIRAIYGPNHRHLSLSTICLHFLEEVGEVAKGLRMLQELPPIVKADKRRRKIVELEDEVADVFSWILGLLNKLDQILQKSVKYYQPLVESELPAIQASVVAVSALNKRDQ